MALVEVSKRDGLAWFELNNPPANCYSYELMKELDAATLDARLDPDVHALVLTGRGDKFFCAGADIHMLSRASPQFKYGFCLHANETLCRLEQTPKLAIAALNGHCVGGGLEIALACDLRVARRGGGKIGLPEVELGVLPGTGGTQRLARLLGKSRAIELMVTGRRMEFDEALALGLIDRVLDAPDFAAAASEYARQFVPPARAARAAGLIKRAVQSGAEASLAEGLALERELQQQLFLSEDAREGLSGYVEKRRPRFKGS
jgi:enoyl-CoA hydratase/carnithine racemase